MGVITISPKAALRKEFIEETVITKMNPKLYFIQAFPVVDLQGASTFSYFQDTDSAEDDIQAGKMGAPLIMSELGQMSKIDVSPIKRKVGDTYQFGYKLEFSKSVTREKGFVDEILRAYDRAAYGMARKINQDIINAMSEFAAAPTATLTDGVWAASSGISADIIKMQEAFDQDGWDYELTDMFANKAQFYNAKQYYRAAEATPWDPEDVEGSRMNNAKSNVTSGTMFNLDMNIKPVTIYKNTDADFSSDPETNIIMIDKYQQQEYPKKQVIELWAELGLGVKYPNAIQKQTGLA